MVAWIDSRGPPPTFQTMLIVVFLEFSFELGLFSIVFSFALSFTSRLYYTPVRRIRSTPPREQETLAQKHELSFEEALC